VQTASGRIFTVGGLVKELILKSTFKIDEDLTYEEMNQMKTGRFNTPIVLVNDRFIVAGGGQINVNNKGNYYTNATEIFDTVNNFWTPVGNLNKPRGNTSMSAINNHVFICNGLSQ